MIKILLALIMAMSLLTTAHAQKTVPVVWGFSAASGQANMVRSIIDSANAQQNKYQFVFTHKPGAGGSLAARTVLESNDLVVLASSSSFYIRPLLYKDSHNVDDFNLVTLYCVGQPLSIFSKKIDRLSVVKNKEISIGILPGSITTLVTSAIKRENPDIKILEVPYKGTPEATSDMLGGHIDGSVDFIGTSVFARFGNDIKVLGITGTRSINGHPTFQSLGVKGLENVTADWTISVNKSVDLVTRQELNRIFNNAVNDRTKHFCEDDFGQISKPAFNQIDSINQANKQRWEKLTAGLARE